MKTDNCLSCVHYKPDEDDIKNPCGGSGNCNHTDHLKKHPTRTNWRNWCRNHKEKNSAGN